MPELRARLAVRVSADEKDRLRRAAALSGVSVAGFIRQAAVREANTVLAHPMMGQTEGVAARLRGRATAGLRTEEITRLTRDE